MAKKGSTLRVVIVGAGAMARKHAAAYSATAETEIVGVVNRRNDRSALFARDFGLDNTSIEPDLAAAIRTWRPDIVSVCVPTAFHAETAIAALHAGAHVLCEKPIALDIAAAERMQKAADENGTLLSIIFNRRFNAIWDELSARIGRIGKPLLYNTQEIRSIRPKRAMHTRSLNGGPVIDCCVHDFDMLLDIFGAARRVYATGTAFGGNKAFLQDVEDIAIDTAQITVEFDGENRASLLYAWGFPPGSPYWQYREFMGPDGIVRLMGEFGEEVRHHREDGRVETVTGLEDDGHLRSVRAFVRAILSGGAAPVPAERAIASLRISIAAVESIETGEIVTL